MYVEIGDFNVGEGEFLPTTDLSENYAFEWETIKGEPYSILMVDKDAPYPEKSINSPYVHFLMVNVMEGKGGHVLFDYVPPTPPTDSRPHKYKIYVFKQGCMVTEVKVPESREGFDLESWKKGLLTFGDGKDPGMAPCPLELKEVFYFFGGVEPTFDDDKNFSPANPHIKTFLERYNADSLSDEDLYILAEVYGIPNSSDLNKEEIQERIGKIISHQ